MGLYQYFLATNINMIFISLYKGINRGGICSSACSLKKIINNDSSRSYAAAPRSEISNPNNKYYHDNISHLAFTAGGGEDGR